MTFLPIADRELRVSSRRPALFRVRWITAAAAALLAFAVLAFTDAYSRTAGLILFAGLTRGAFLFAVYSGPFLAADSISEEKREGTLGLLFLTDLSGLDIVGGKLLITGLAAVTALAAVLPVVAVAWILGGVTGGEFWRTALVLIHTLLLSLTVSLAVSAFHRRQARALAWSAGILTTLVFGGGLLSLFASAPGAPGILRWLAAGSPWVAFQAAADADYRLEPGRFWGALVWGQVWVWAALGVAAFLTARRWQDFGETPAKPVRARPWRAFLDGPARRMSPQLLDQNPVLAWRVSRVRMRLFAWMLAGLGAFLVVANLALSGAPLLPFTYVPIVGLPSSTPYVSLVLTAVLLLLKVLFAWEACDFWVEGRRQGGLEMLLSTPVTDELVLAAQWTVLRRTFLGPLILLLVALTLGPAAQAFLMSGTAGAGSVNALAAWGLWMYLLVTLPLEMLALAWMGAWLALSGTRPSRAFGLTVLLVMVLPALFFCLPSFLAAGVWFGYARSRMMLPLRTILQGVEGPWRRRPKAVAPQQLYGEG